MKQAKKKKKSPIFAFHEGLLCGTPGFSGQRSGLGVDLGIPLSCWY